MGVMTAGAYSKEVRGGPFPDFRVDMVQMCAVPLVALEGSELVLYLVGEQEFGPACWERGGLVEGAYVSCAHRDFVLECG